MTFKGGFLRRRIEPVPTALVLECDVLGARQLEQPMPNIGCVGGILARVLVQEKIRTGIDLDPEEIARATDGRL